VPLEKPILVSLDRSAMQTPNLYLPGVSLVSTALALWAKYSLFSGVKSSGNTSPADFRLLDVVRAARRRTGRPPLRPL
jgi:hypothetical protein